MSLGSSATVPVDLHSNIFIADPADSLLHFLTWYCLLQKLAQVPWGRVSTEASSAAASSVCTGGVVSQQRCFPVQRTGSEHGLGREECSEVTPWHQGDGFWHLSAFCALIFGLRVFVCRVEFLGLTPLETETPLNIKGALVEGGAGLVSDERMDSSSLNKSSLSIQSQNGRVHSRTLEYYSDSAVLFPALCDEGMCQSCHQVCLSNLFDFFLQCPQTVQRCGALLQWRDRQAWNLQRHQKRNAVSHSLQGKSDASRVASFSRDLVNFKPET